MKVFEQLPKRWHTEISGCACAKNYNKFAHTT
jgi:hypothetical protein